MKPVVFAHGLASSPGGTKAVLLGKTVDAHTPDLRPFGLDGQVSALSRSLPSDRPSVVVGSSLGALAALGLAQREAARIASLVLLAPADGV